MPRTDDEIRQAVREAYGARATAVAASCCEGNACGVPSAAGQRAAPNLAFELYAGPEADGVPADAVSYGCGNPLAIEALRPGEVVVDLGSGAGFDCLLAGDRVGAAGRVIGVDMTPEMIALARKNIAEASRTNIEFRLGEIEALPVEGSTADVVISNCVLNLLPDKAPAFREAFRVLRPGGRLQAADIVALRPFSEADQADLDQWAGCVSGALLKDDYERGLRDAGFEDVVIDAPPADGAPWVSAHISARKPAGG
jgi:SAM-dependent methyltransferase